MWKVLHVTGMLLEGPAEGCQRVVTSEPQPGAQFNHVFQSFISWIRYASVFINAAVSIG